jgi:stage V sporulation protein R
LKLADARDTLANLQAIWSRPVHLETVRDEKPVLMSFDGTDHSITPIGGDDEPRRPTVRKP